MSSRCLAHALDVGAFDQLFQHGAETPLVVAVRGVVPGALVDLIDVASTSSTGASASIALLDVHVN